MNTEQDKSYSKKASVTPSYEFSYPAVSHADLTGRRSLLKSRDGCAGLILQWARRNEIFNDFETLLRSSLR
jgi:hypothetical protein